MKPFAGELIGKTIEIVGATNPTLNGKKGTIINETKMTITLRQGTRMKTILKSAIVRLKLADRLLEGRSLLGRTEERLKWHH